MKQYDVPILLILFKRIDSTKLILNELRKQKPKYIYIVADGPRNEKEKKETDALRKFVLDEINWPCKVKKVFRDKNWGCDNSSVDALNWFFRNVEYGIFLEDDCLPSQSFFRFHKEMLEKYKNEDKVKCVCGVNFLTNYEMENSYTFSKTAFSGWGFSTWRKEWGLNYEKIKKAYKKGLKNEFPYLFQRMSVKRKLNLILDKRMEGWDYLFATQKASENKLAIFPDKNLVENIGFELDSTHEFNEADKKYLWRKGEEMNFPLKHPNSVADDKNFDRKMNRWAIKKFLSKKLNFVKLK